MTQFAHYPSLADKAVIITGGASGIGADIVRAFAGQGARVGFLDIDGDASAALKADIDGTVDFEICDLRDIAAMKAGLAALRGRLGPFTTLVNNAARDDRHDWADVSVEFWDERMATNLRHMFFAIQDVAPDMIAAGGGSIVNIGSNSWWENQGGFPAYTTAKSAVHCLTPTMARGLGGHPVPGNTGVPGWILTTRPKDMLGTPRSLANHQKRQCLPDLIDPVYVARMVVFLASDDAAMCTSNNYMVEAGSI